MRARYLRQRREPRVPRPGERRATARSRALDSARCRRTRPAWPDPVSYTHLVFANAVATFPSYWLNRNWAWGKSGRSHLMKEVVPFWVMSAFGIAFSIVGASVARHLGHGRSHTCLLYTSRCV